MTRQANHYVPQMGGYVLCNHCLKLALEQSETANKIFGELKDVLNLPDSIEAIRRFKGDSPRGMQLFIALIRESQVLHANDGVPKGVALVQGAQNLAEKLEKQRTKLPWWRFGRKANVIDNEHLILAYTLIEDLIKVGFNNKGDQAAGIYKVTGTKLLFFTVAFMAMAEPHMVELNRLARQESMPLGTRLFSIDELTNGRLTDDGYRTLTKEFNADGFKVKNEEVFADQAYHWYQSRVTFSGPTSYCTQEGKRLLPVNINNEIRVCDVAMGYPRRGAQAITTKIERSVQTTLLLNASLLLEALIALGPLLDQYVEYIKNQDMA